MGFDCLMKIFQEHPCKEFFLIWVLEFLDYRYLLLSPLYISLDLFLVLRIKTDTQTLSEHMHRPSHPQDRKHKIKASLILI